MRRYIQEAEKNLLSPKGIEIRINRSIQAEGAFGVLKQNTRYVRVRRTSKEKVSTEIMLTLIGLVVAAIIGIVIKNTKKNIVGLGMCFAIYVISEIISNIRSSYLVEIILLFVGTLALGGIIGFLIGLIVSKIRK